jgi:hypothetical protein
MAKNAELEEVVLKEMAFHLKDEPSVKFIMEGDEEGTKELIKTIGKLQVDEEYKIRFNFSRIIGYGYDFNKKTEEGIPARNLYLNAIKHAQEFSNHPNFEKFLKEGIVNSRFGWYLTSI